MAIAKHFSSLHNYKGVTTIEAEEAVASSLILQVKVLFLLDAAFPMVGYARLGLPNTHG